MTDQRLRQFRLKFTVLTPLHIGAGIRYYRDYDFRDEGGQRVRLIDVDRALELVPERAIGRIADGRIAAALDTSTLERATRAMLPVYGTRAVGQDLLAFIRDGMGRVYLPGSSLKGAFRSALLDAYVEQHPQSIRETVRAGGGSRERAAQAIEQKAFAVELDRTQPEGDFPNRDINRWLRLADAYPVGSPEMVAAEVQVRSVSSRGRQAIPVWVEAVSPGTVFETTLALAPAAWDPWKSLDATRRALYGQDLQKLLQHWGGELRKVELGHWRRHDSSVASRFEGQVRDGEIAFPLGFGTGWVAKTIGRHVRPDRELMRALIQRYGLTRSRALDPEYFPIGHRVVDGPGGWLPMGWVKLAQASRVQ
ncbi:MAG: hypothetical protein Kow0010_26470 [Dehalococcoidia bacterium]